MQRLMDKLEKFKKLLNSVEIVSFDVFDTLLIRPYINPIDLFTHIEKFSNAEGFADERVLAESRTRCLNKHLQDITIDEIYNNICYEYSHLKEVEIEVEKQILRQNPLIIPFYEAALTSGKRIIAVSDMYLPEKFISDVLKVNGYSNIEKVFVSCEYNANKSTGKLFNIVEKELNIKPSNIVHIGDNLKSDYFKPLERGYKAIFLEKYTDKFFKTNVGKRYFKLYKKYNCLDFSILCAMRATYGFCAKDKNYWYSLGYNFGGIFAYSYVDFIIKNCRLNDIDNLFFVSRDGYILQKVYKMLAKDNLLESHYIYAARILNARCFLDHRNNYEYLKHICEMNSDICPELKRVPKSFDQAEALLKSNEVYLEKRTEENFNEYKKYLETLNITNRKIAVIDVTTGSFSSQAFLTKFFRDNIKLGIFSCTFCPSYEFKYKTFIEKVLKQKDVIKVNILELLFTAPELPLDYIKDSKPIYRVPTKIDLHRVKIYEEIEQGILDFVTDYKNLFGSFGLAFSGKSMFELLDLLTKYRTQEDIRYLGHINHASDINNKIFQTLYFNINVFILLRHKIYTLKKTFFRKLKLYLKNRYRTVKYHFYELTKNLT